MQPGSSGRDVDIRRQEPVGITDDAKRKLSCATRASPALAHGADEGYSVVKEQSDADVAAENENGSLAAASVQSNTEATTVNDDRPSAKNSYHSVRSLKHKNDRSYKYGTGSADLQRSSSLQDLTVGGVDRSGHLSTEKTVSCGTVDSDTSSDVCHLHGTLSSPSDACSTNPACTGYNSSSAIYTGDQLSSSPPRSRYRVQQSAADPELQLVGSTGIVSNTAQFWEDMTVDSSNSVAQNGVCSRYANEDRHRFKRARRDASCPRYLTVGAPCDIQALHGMNCGPKTTQDTLSRSESLHVNGDLEVCFWLLSYNLVACLHACLGFIRHAAI